MTPSPRAQEISSDMRDVANRVMQNIFDRVVFEKDKYDELADFEKTSMTDNAHAIRQVEYTLKEENVAENYQPYGFAITILPVDEPLPDQWKDGGFEAVFPLLKLKFAGYQRRAINGRFDIQSAMQRYGQMLLEYQQKYMPIQLSIEVEKDEFKVQEDILFTVTLTNTSSQIMRVKPMNPENLFILYDGTKFLSTSAPARGDQQYVNLEPHKSISKTFHGDAFQFAREIEIYASYNMTFEDIKPFSARKIRIVQ